MKRLLLISITLITTSLILSAAQIDQATAKKVAENFYLQNSKKQIKDIRLAYIENGDSGSLVFYVFNINENDGWVMVSADDAVTPILGYNTVGHYTAKGTSPEFDYWKNTYKKHIDFIKSQRIQPTKEIKTRWSTYENIENIIRTRVSSVVVEPLLGDIQWGQGTFYNDFCPQLPLDIGKAPTGCTITAQAQIMKYWNWPPFGNGITKPYVTKGKIESFSYNGTNINLSWEFQIPPVDLSNVLYNWNAMPNQLNSSNDAVAQLMYHVGVSLKAEYGFETPAWGNPDNYINVFGFDDTAHYYECQRVSASEWVNLLKTELINSRPIHYNGWSEVMGGHSWVIDGIDANNMFHMNWGWDGSPNGYYEITLTTPNVPGFKDEQTAITGIKPRGCFISKITNPSFPCLSVPISFKSATSVTATNYQWTVNGENIIGANASTFTSTKLNGNDTVRCVINKGSINESVSNAIVIESFALESQINSRWRNNKYIGQNSIHVFLGDSITLSSPMYLGNQWYENGQPIDGETNYKVTVKPKSNTFYYFKNSFTENCSTDTLFVNTILPATLEKPTILTRGTSSICNEEGVWLQTDHKTININKDQVFISIQDNLWFRNDTLLHFYAVDSIYVTNPGNYFVVARNWLSDGFETDTSTVITISKGIMIKAISSHFAGTTNGSGCFEKDTPITLEANIGENYRFLNWTDNNTIVSTDSNYTFIVDTSRTLVANFVETSYSISAITNPITGGTVSGLGNYTHQDSCKLNATAEKGHVFSNWTDATGKIVSSTSAYSFVVSQSTTLTANFDLTPIVETVQPTEKTLSGSITIFPAKGYLYSIDGISYQISNVFFGLPVGSYNVTLKDENGNITQPVFVTLNTSGILTAKNYRIKVTHAACPGSNEGKIEISTEKSYNYNVTLKSNNSKTEKFTGTSYSFTELAAGTYELCFTIDGLENYNQCFDVVINQPQDLSVFKSGISDNRAVYTLSGGTRYAIDYNGKMIETTEKTVEVPLRRGRNVIRITTDSQCQGVYEDIVYSNETDDIILFPNPTTGQFSMIIPGEDIEVTVEIVSIIGSILIKEKKKVPINRLVDMNAFSLQNGVYLVKVSGKTVNSVVKLLKNNL